MRRYNWQQPNWPHFNYDVSVIQDLLFAIAEKTGLLSGKLSHLNRELHTEALLNLLVEEAIKTSEIEGEHISRPDVRSSIKNHLGLNHKIIPVHDKRAQGISELMMNVRDTFQAPLTEEHLFDWHLMLMSRSINPNLRVGFWRTHEEPMQIVSEKQGRWIVHYEAPPSGQVPKEMAVFIQWFNDTAPGNPKSIKFSAVRAAIAHLYFESIHPFEDGNGRIGRAIAEKALSQGAGHPILLSLSHAIEANKKAYYAALHRASLSNEISPWLEYFVNIIWNAQLYAEQQINFTLKKFHFLNTFESICNERQLKIIKRMLQAGIQGFEGGMSAKKYIKIANTSKATATRDLQELLEIKALKQIGAGRSTHYELML